MTTNKDFQTTVRESSTLSTGNYTIEFSDGPSHIYKFDENKNRIWIAAASDPQVAMEIVEGLILVEHKRFYHPDSAPNLTVETKDQT